MAESQQARREANTWPSPVLSWQRGMLSAAAGSAIAAGVTIMAPLVPLVGCGMVAIGAAMGGSMLGRTRRYRAQRLELLRDRKFTVDRLPIAPEDLVPLPEDWWSSEGIPYRTEYQDLELAGSRQRRAVKVLPPEHRTGCGALRSFCKERCPERYAEVVAWWKVECLAPLVHEREPKRPWKSLPQERRDALQALVEVEFLEGIAEALAPDRWRRKVDQRPSMLRLQRLRDRLRAAFPEATAPDGVPWLRFPRRRQIWFGRGYEWQPRHAERLVIERSRDLDQIAAEVIDNRTASRLAATVDGDPRAYGVGCDEAIDIYFEESKFSQHAVVLGGSGFGKSRAIESPLQVAIGNGDPVFVLDPKGDPRLINMVVEMARAYGRAADFQFMSLVEPYHPEVATYNPLGDYLQPTELQGRVLAVIPPSKEQFFVEEAASTGRVVGMLCHWLSRYLAAVGDGDHLAHHPPELLLWLHYCKHAGVDGRDPAAVATARVAFAPIHVRLQREGYRFHAANPIEAELRRMWMCAEYHPATWNPNFGQMSIYGVQRPHRLVSWAIRLLHYHILADYEPFDDLEWPQRDSWALVAGKDESQIGLITLYQRARVHPLSAIADQTSAKHLERWGPLYRAVPLADPGLVAHIVDQAEETLAEQITNAEMPREDYDKRNSSLKSPVSTLSAGGKRRILCDPDPDISWRRVVGERKIVYLALGQMVDRAGSNAVAKTVIQGLTAYLGQILARQADNPPRLWFFGDEMPSWATPEWSDIIDKARSAGIRSFNLSQTIPGLMAAVGDRNKVLHMLGSFAATFQFGVQNDEDCQLYAKMCGNVNIMIPSRSVSLSPGLGGAGNTMISGYSANESRNFQDRAVPLVDPSQIARMPIGQTFVRRFGKTYILQIGLLPAPTTNYLAEIGLSGEAFAGNPSGGASRPGQNAGGWWTPPAQEPSSESAPPAPPPPPVPEPPAERALDEYESLPAEEAPVLESKDDGIDIKLLMREIFDDAGSGSPAFDTAIEDQAEKPGLEWDPADEPDLQEATVLPEEIPEADPEADPGDDHQPMAGKIEWDFLEPGVDDEPEDLVNITPTGYQERGPAIQSRRHGHWRVTRPDGTVYAEGCYEHDLREGEWTFFAPSGEVVRRVMYRAGEASEESDKPAGKGAGPGAPRLARGTR